MDPIRTETEFHRPHRADTPKVEEEERMKKVMFNGVSPRGTLRPRRMWTPGDILDVADDVSEELLREPGFLLVKTELKAKPKSKGR